jgi:murein DD-endopeptidase MepM/ murein hydrolase activator NlpD
VADLGANRTEASGARFAMPAEGRIVRPYDKGRNDGIGIGAAAGSAVRAAADGTVAAITRDTEQVPIIVLRHADNLLTVYANVEGIAVDKDQKVTRGQTIAAVRAGAPAFLHFEVRRGFESLDPMPFLQ